MHVPQLIHFSEFNIWVKGGMMVPTKNLPFLLNLAYYGYNRGIDIDGDFKPTTDADGKVTTHCNQFVQFVLNGMGYGEMNGMNADEMVAYMSDSKNGWISVSDDVAQQHANNGVIVVPGWSNPQGHGHVCLVVPGVLEKSVSFGRAVPKVVSVGTDVFFGKRLSFAFSAERQPKLFALAAMV